MNTTKVSNCLILVQVRHYIGPDLDSYCLKYYQKPTKVSISKETVRLAQSLMSFFSKTDYLSKIAIYKLYLEVEVLGLDH